MADNRWTLEGDPPVILRWLNGDPREDVDACYAALVVAVRDSETLAKVREIAATWDHGDYGDDSAITEQEAATHSMAAIVALLEEGSGPA